ncbi:MULTISPECIES: WhiB family transcriptional regulator [unclassified Streptomyces]|uniref:WhiB family transcriptional regulator n=1 Tax=unclassified Streptomyces TaxID=2593676 RepID=UPI0033BC8310
MSREWELKAACRDRNPAIWFNDSKADRAKVICGFCPVQESCLAAVLGREHGLPKSQRHGIVAGLTGAQRWSLSREQDEERKAKQKAPKRKAAPGKREPARCGTRSGYLRHRKHKEEACAPCKAANARGEQQYRRTGSTRVLA